MKTSKILISVLVLAALLLSSCGNDPFKGPAGSPLREYGQLQVIGTDLCDQNGNPIQLRGVSSLDVQEYRFFINPETLQWMRDDWDMEVFRGAMYVDASGRYVGDNKISSMKNAVEYSLEAGLYVLIDWHILGDGDPLKWMEKSKEFFEEMSQLYRDYPNVIYEICNEPNGNITWADNVKPYAEEIIPIIRANDPDSIIIVGSPTWSQDVDIAARDPLEYDNIMYAAHFYSGTHGAQLRSKIETALELGAPIFVSEWGTTKADGHQGIYPALTADWIEFMDQHNLSWCNWSLSNALEDSAMLWQSASLRGQWELSDITESGLLVRNVIKGGRQAVFADGFENNKFLAGRWERIGVNVLREGVYAGEVSGELLDGDSLTKAYPTERFGNIEVEAQISLIDFSSDDKFLLEWFDGSQWHVAQEWTGNSDWKKETVNLPVEAEGLDSFKFRFRAEAPGGGRALLDNVSLNMEMQL